MLLLKNKWPFICLAAALVCASCSTSRQIRKEAEQILFADSSIQHAHLGISVYDDARNKYVYNHNAEKYFIPASNTKLFSLYAGLKYLGDSLPGAAIAETADTLYLFPAGDPSFLNPEFAYQPLLSFLRQTNKPIAVADTMWKEEPLGYGWAWDDYNSYYMAERSALPVFGNVATVSGSKSQPHISPAYFSSFVRWADEAAQNKMVEDVSRQRGGNDFFVPGTALRDTSVVTFSTNNGLVNYQVLASESGKPVVKTFSIPPGLQKRQVHSIPTDSLLKPMMHRSDNFFAEQTLLMAGNQVLGYMHDADIINYLLKNDLAGLPQKPKWVDGSGLSRYNLFTPQDFVFILEKLRADFGKERIENILATGGEGTLRSYYQNIAGSIYAKTGTLSNNCALSGFLYTRKGKLLIFSVLANNYYGSATPVRKAVEKFLIQLRDKY